MLIVHYCQGMCAQPDYRHRHAPYVAHEETGMCCGLVRGSSTTAPTWVTRTGEPVTTPQEPGTHWQAGLHTCGCHDCRALYRQLTEEMAR